MDDHAFPIGSPTKFTLDNLYLISAQGLINIVELPVHILKQSLRIYPSQQL